MAVETRATKQSGRVVTRWVAACDFFVAGKGQSATRCPWNDREDPERHRSSESAEREASRHAVAAAHVNARAVQVRRVFKPRELEREEIVGS